VSSKRPVEARFPPDGEVDILQAIIVSIHDYKSLPTVEESERAEIVKAEQILQRLLAANQQLADDMVGSSPATRKLLAR